VFRSFLAKITPEWIRTKIRYEDRCEDRSIKEERERREEMTELIDP
jgi:hypothetical protein